MRPLAIIIYIIVGLTSCKSDDFHSVTKVIEAPDQVQLEEPFTLRLKLINETGSVIPLTLDKDITKSIHFNPDWYCGDDWLQSKTPNPKSQRNDFYSVDLMPGDSLTFALTAQIKTYSNKDSLIFIINDYERDFRVANPECSDFSLSINGMWLPGNGPFADSMEGYDFGTRTKIETTANPKN